MGVWNSILLFPSNIQSIEFTDSGALFGGGERYDPLHTRTKEGLGLHLHVALQYQLQKENVGKLYNEFNQNYEQVYVSSVRDILIKAASQYRATQLWQDRQGFGDNMQKMVNAALNMTYASCWGLQLMVIDLPDVFEDSIVHTQVQKQSVQTREHEQSIAQIEAETKVIMAQYDKTVKVIRAQGVANYTLITKRAQARAQRQRIDVEADVMAMVIKSLHVDPDGLVEYQKFSVLDDLPEAQVVFGFGEDTKYIVDG